MANQRYKETKINEESEDQEKEKDAKTFGDYECSNDINIIDLNNDLVTHDQNYEEKPQGDVKEKIDVLSNKADFSNYPMNSDINLNANPNYQKNNCDFPMSKSKYEENSNCQLIHLHRKAVSNVLKKINNHSFIKQCKSKENNACFRQMKNQDKGKITKRKILNEKDAYNLVENLYNTILLNDTKNI